MKKYRSHAEWEPGVYCMGNETTDDHYTQQEAEGVCRLLERNGFGGERKHFPVRTWVSEIQEH